MKYNPNLHHRRSLRLKNYNYSQPGLYFITICTQNKAKLFGKIIDNKMILNIAGKMVDKIWLEIPKIFPNTRLHEYVIMPNHFHAIVEITQPVVVGADSISAPNNTDSVSAHNNVDSISAPFADAIPDHVGAESISTPNENTESISALNENTQSVFGANMEFAIVRANMEFARTDGDDGVDIKNGVNMKSNGDGNNRDGVGNVSLPKIVQTFKRYTIIEYRKCVCYLFYDAGKIDFFPDELNKFANIFYTGI